MGNSIVNEDMKWVTFKFTYEMQGTMAYEAKDSLEWYSHVRESLVDVEASEDGSGSLSLLGSSLSMSSKKSCLLLHVTPYFPTLARSAQS